MSATIASIAALEFGRRRERPYFALQLRRTRQLRFHRIHVRHLPIDLDPRVEVTTEQIAHGWLRVRWEQSGCFCPTPRKGKSFIDRPIQLSSRSPRKALF